MVRKIKNTVQFKKDVSARNRTNGVSAGWHPWSIVEKKRRARPFWFGFVP